MKKLQLFDQNCGLSPLQKYQFCGFLKPMLFFVQKGLFAIGKVENHFLDDLFSRSKTWEYRGLAGVTKGH